MIRMNVVMLFAFLLMVALEVRAAGMPLVESAAIPLPGNATRLDYASIDPVTHRLFIAHLGDSAVIVVDTAHDKVIADIAGIGHVHGVLAVPALGRIYASATATDEIAVIDENSLKVVARIPGGFYPDGMAYAPKQNKLYVSDEHGETETVIDLRRNQRIATIRLDSEVGNSQYDPVSGHVFMNAQTSGKLIEIDPATDRIIARHPLPGCDAPHGLLIDSGDRLVFVACQDNSRLLVLNQQSMAVSHVFTIGQDPDVLALDPGVHRLYVAGEDGIVAMFDLSGGMKKIWQGFLGDNAHVVAVDPQTHEVYFPLKNVGGKPVLEIMK